MFVLYNNVWLCLWYSYMNTFFNRSNRKNTESVQLFIFSNFDVFGRFFGQDGLKSRDRAGGHRAFFAFSTQVENTRLLLDFSLGAQKLDLHLPFALG